MNKILFLDIDGVVNCRFTAERFMGYLGIDPTMAQRIQRIVTETECDVVLSSTWRLDAPFREEVKRKVCEFVDVTPDLQKGLRYGVTPRGEEVKHWLDRHPDVSHHAILDDNSDFLDGQPLFLTNFTTGITDEITNTVIKFLNEGEMS